LANQVHLLNVYVKVEYRGHGQGHTNLTIYRHVAGVPSTQRQSCYMLLFSIKSYNKMLSLALNN